jgi:hypothetical protein
LFDTKLNHQLQESIFTCLWFFCSGDHDTEWASRHVKSPSTQAQEKDTFVPWKLVNDRFAEPWVHSLALNAMTQASSRAFFSRCYYLLTLAWRLCQRPLYASQQLDLWLECAPGILQCIEKRLPDPADRKCTIVCGDVEVQSIYGILQLASKEGHAKSITMADTRATRRLWHTRSLLQLRFC